MYSTRDLSIVNIRKPGHLNDAYPAVCLTPAKHVSAFALRKIANFH